MRAPILAAAAAALALAAGCAEPAAEGPPTGGGDGAAARVERVVDGDTLVARAGGERIRVRLLGIDTPESVRPSSPVECFGPEAAGRTAALLPPGSAVRLQTDPTQDTYDDYGRLIAYVLPAGGGPPVNERLLREGYARLYVYRGRAFRRLDAFRAAERAAREAARGLWHRCGAEAPGAPAPRAAARSCPADRPVKGNIPRGRAAGEPGIYHLPGSPSYAATNPERCFASAGQAEAAGFRAPRGPG